MLLAIIASSNVAAVKIYHWVDENGIPNFSQYRPGSDVPGVSEQELVEATLPDQAEDVYNVEAHAKLMADWREELKQKREDARERKRRIAEQQPIRYQQPEPNYFGSFWYPPYYHRPPVRPPNKPVPPVAVPGPPSTLRPRGN